MLIVRRHSTRKKALIKNWEHAKDEGNIRLFAGDYCGQTFDHCDLVFRYIDAFDEVDVLVNASRRVF